MLFYIKVRYSISNVTVLSHMVCCTYAINVMGICSQQKECSPGTLACHPKKYLKIEMKQLHNILLHRNVIL